MSDYPKRPAGAQIDVFQAGFFNIAARGPAKYLRALKSELERFGDVEYGLNHTTVRISVYNRELIPQILEYLKQYVEWAIEDFDAKEASKPTTIITYSESWPWWKRLLGIK